MEAEGPGEGKAPTAPPANPTIPESESSAEVLDPPAGHGRVRRGAARQAAQKIQSAIGTTPSKTADPEELLLRKKNRELRETVKAEFAELLSASNKKGKRKKRHVVEVPSEVQALRQSQEMVAVYQFLLIFHQSVGVNFDDKTPEMLEQHYQDADSLLIQDMNAKLLRKLRRREDIIFSNWLEHFRLAYAQNEPGDDVGLTEFAVDYKDMEPTTRVQCTYLITNWLVSNPVLRNIIDKMPAYELVGVPVGRDSKHGRYWNFGDMRLYKETPEMKTRDSEWATVCVEAEEWIDQLRAFERSSSVHDKKMGVWLAEVLPGMMELLEKREVNRRRLENPEFVLKRSSRVKEKDSRSEEEKRKQYMLQEEMRVRRVKEAELIRRRKAEVFKCAASLRAGSELANSVETAEELIEAQAEIERRKEAERKRDRDMRRDRKQRREEEMAHQHAYEAMKNEWNEKLRAYRHQERENRKLGLPIPPMPEELNTPPPPYVPLVEKRAQETAAAAARAAGHTQDTGDAGAANYFSDPRRQYKSRTPVSSGLLLGGFDEFLEMYSGRRLVKNKTGAKYFSSAMANAAAVAVDQGQVESIEHWHALMDEARKVEAKTRAREIAKQRRAEVADRNGSSIEAPIEALQQKQRHSEVGSVTGHGSNIPGQISGQQDTGKMQWHEALATASQIARNSPPSSSRAALADGHRWLPVLPSGSVSNGGFDATSSGRSSQTIPSSAQAVQLQEPTSTMSAWSSGDSAVAAMLAHSRAPNHLPDFSALSRMAAGISGANRIPTASGDEQSNGNGSIAPSSHVASGSASRTDMKARGFKRPAPDDAGVENGDHPSNGVLEHLKRPKTDTSRTIGNSGDSTASEDELPASADQDDGHKKEIVLTPAPWTTASSFSFSATATGLAIPVVGEEDEE